MEGPPQFSCWTAERGRHGYEPGVAEALGAELGRTVERVKVPWLETIPAVQRGDTEAVLCGQGITAKRSAQVNFTWPYAIFHEGVLVRRRSAIHGTEEWYLGVQWHPEDSDGPADRLRLSGAFLAAAEECRRGSVAQLAT